MIQPDAFDAFYRDARARLLVQTYALTGDLPAARSAVRDSFIVTWHHWRKVSRLPDPEAWVRPHAWAQAQRRHTARIWHRDKSLDPAAKATLDALGSLSLAQRQALVLERTTTLSPTDRARELGMTLTESERRTAAATEKFLAARDVADDEVAGLFDQLAALSGASRLPRASILRRAGAARRRTHTAVGAVAAVAAVLVTGTVVSGSTLEGDPADAATQASDGSGVVIEPLATFTSKQLLRSSDLRPLVGGRGWQEGETTDNSEGTGRVAPCQQERYADPKGVSTLVRTFETGRRGTTSAVQYAELSGSPRHSGRAWQRMLRWYGGCVTPRVQLVGTHRVTGVGDEAMIFALRSWRGAGESYAVGVARTGQVVTSTLLTSTAGAPALDAAARMLGSAVDGLCGITGAARCTTRPVVEETTPVKVGDVPSLLVEADLPPVSGVNQPWVGTEARQARTNTAATRCDRADFSQPFISNAMTRTFLVPNARVPAAFGITETVGTMPVERARGFVAGVRDRMSSCNDRDAGSEVTPLASSSSAEQDVSLWRVTSEINDDENVTYLMGIVRRGGAVGQIGFVPGSGVEMEPGAFDALVRRALARLEFLPDR